MLRGSRIAIAGLILVGGALLGWGSILLLRSPGTEAAPSVMAMRSSAPVNEGRSGSSLRGRNDAPPQQTFHSHQRSRGLDQLARALVQPATRIEGFVET